MEAGIVLPIVIAFAIGVLATALVSVVLVTAATIASCIVSIIP